MNLSGIADSNGKEKESLIDGTGTTATAKRNKKKQQSNGIINLKWKKSCRYQIGTMCR